MSHALDEDALAWLHEHRASALLSSLALLDDDDAALARFAEQLPNPALTTDDLRAARDLATALCRAMLSENRSAWAAISRAHEALGSPTLATTTGTLRGAPAPAPARPSEPKEWAVASSRADAACFPLTVQDYAALVVRSQEATPKELAQLRAEYGVDGDAHHRRIDEVFSAAFAQDADLRTQFAKALRRVAGDGAGT